MQNELYTNESNKQDIIILLFQVSCKQPIHESEEKQKVKCIYFIFS